MKKILIVVSILLSCTALGLVGGNIWGGRVREAEPIGFYIGTRVGYWTRGIIAGAASGVLVAAAWLIASNTGKKTGSQNIILEGIPKAASGSRKPSG